MPCNLTPDPTHLVDFTGKTGDSASLTVKGTLGTAQMTGGFYAGAAISINPAKFDIKPDENLLDLVIENTLSNDVTLLVCDDGTVLDRFRFDRNNPTRLYDVKGV